VSGFRAATNRRASLKEVAALAGTSVATASRAMSGIESVADETRARVLDAARRLNYQLNLRAKELRQQSSRTIGLLIPTLLNPYYMVVADEISRLLTRSGYHLQLAASGDDPVVQREVLHNMIGHDVEGIVWVPCQTEDELIGYLRTQLVPIVSLVRRVPKDFTDTVVFEDYNGSRMVMQHLLELGHRRIGYIAGDVKHSSNLARWQGYQTALEEAGLPFDNELQKLGSAGASWGEIATLDLLHIQSPPTALYVASNPMMPGVLKTLNRYQIKVPHDMSLICFDDLEWFAFLTPPISAVRVRQSLLAELAVDLLLRRIHDGNESAPRPIIAEIGFELVQRGSTNKPRLESLRVGEESDATSALQPGHAGS
jgi:DNA-binding LacI/PurR family transcriptional regulator